MFHFDNKQHSLRFGIDVFCILVCYTLASFIAHRAIILPLRVYDFVLCFGLIIMWYYGSKFCNLYANNKGTLRIEFPKLLFVGLLQAIPFFISYWTTAQHHYPKMFTLYYVISLLVIMYLQKTFVNSVRAVKYSDRQQNNVLLVGGGKQSVKFYDYIMSHPAAGYNLVGVLADKQPFNAFNGHYLGGIDRLDEMFGGDIPINEVVVALPDTEVASLKRVMSLSNDQAVHVKVIPDYQHIVKPGCTVQTVGEMLMVNPRPEPLESLHLRAVKRGFDIVFSALVLILLCSWMFPVIAVMIKLTSKGPVFFKQKRAGKNRKPFWCYKFRSMHPNADSDKKRAAKGDTRITAVGRFLRKSNLDELPQFFNVLMGDMAVVGPRPHMIAQNRDYANIIRQYLVRQLIKPGVTGWAQVKGLRGETKTYADMQNRVEHDVWYIEHWSFGLDIKIIFLTVWNMIKGEENAY